MESTPESRAELLGRALARNRRWLIFALVAVVAVVVYRSRDGGEERWNGFVYPEGVRSPEHTWIPSGLHPSLERCRAWAQRELQRRFPDGVPPSADYECGLNCKPRPSGLNVCERTTR